MAYGLEAAPPAAADLREQVPPRQAARRKIGTIILVVALGVLMDFVFAVTGLLSVHALPGARQDHPRREPPSSIACRCVLGGAFLGILLTSFGVLLQALYLAGDMDFLLSAPIPMRAVFLTKLLQAILPNFGLMLSLRSAAALRPGLRGRLQRRCITRLWSSRWRRWRWPRPGCPACW